MSPRITMTLVQGTPHKLYRLQIGATVIREQISAFSEQDVRDALDAYANPRPFVPVKDDTWATKPGRKPKALSIRPQEGYEDE